MAVEPPRYDLRGILLGSLCGSRFAGAATIQIFREIIKLQRDSGGTTINNYPDIGAVRLAEYADPKFSAKGVHG